MTEVIQACKYCERMEGHLRGCDLCGKVICSNHAHYLSVKETTIKGVSHRTIRICPDCRPRTYSPKK